MKMMTLILLFAGVVIAVLSPLISIGDQKIGPGGGLVLNGGVALLLIIGGGVCGLILSARNRRLANKGQILR